MMWRWRESFARDPDQAISDLFNGRAGLGMAFRRDLAEILYQEFGNEAEQAADREKLDDALFAWLSNMRRNYRQEVARLDFDVYGKRLCEALRTLQLLSLPRSIHHIREVHSAWLRWLAPLRLAPERDPALESWRLISQAQPNGASPAPWLQLARDRRPEYLDVALLGLQRLPLSDQKDNQVLQVSALLHHYGALSGSPEQQQPEFKRHLAALRGLYPRGPAHWQEVVATATDGMEDHLLPARTRQFLQAIRLGEKPAAKGGCQTVHCPSFEQNQAVLNAVRDSKRATSDVAPRLLRLLEEYQHYAQQTGDGHFFVRTLCNHGHHFLQRPDIPAADLAQIGESIEEALHWEPNHAFTWTFWAEWLAYQGREIHQGWVLRETARLFPDNAPCRVELARLLIRRGVHHWPEAEHWLREVANRHPDNGPSRVILAQLLTHTSRQRDAITLLENFLKEYPDNSSNAQGTLNRLRTGQKIEIAAEPDQKTSFSAHQPHHEAPSITGLLPLLRDRAQRQEDYSLARHVQDNSARERLKEAAATGDVLAGLYWEWLPDHPADVPVPPHAWAWQLARCFIGTNASQTWDALERTFPENWETTRYLRWLASPCPALDADMERRMDAKREQADSLPPAERFALESWQRLKVNGNRQEERRDIAFALLQAKAEPSFAV